MSMTNQRFLLLLNSGLERISKIMSKPYSTQTAVEIKDQLKHLLHTLSEKEGGSL